jgi:hypothetical protein
MKLKKKLKKLNNWKVKLKKINIIQINSIL